MLRVCGRQAGGVQGVCAVCSNFAVFLSHKRTEQSCRLPGCRGLPDSLHHVNLKNLDSSLSPLPMPSGQTVFDALVVRGILTQSLYLTVQPVATAAMMPLGCL